MISVRLTLRPSSRRFTRLAISSPSSFRISGERSARAVETDAISRSDTTAATAGAVFREQVTAEHGVWVQLSVPMVSEAVLQAVLPCTIWAETTVAGQQLQSGQKLISVPAGVASVVPFGDGRYVVQTLSPIPSTSTLSVETNKVCILTLEEDTTGPAGTTYIVTAADCESANDLECETSCSQSVGWTITIPGGTELLTGN